MKTNFFLRHACHFAAPLFLVFQLSAAAADFQVRNSGFVYYINDVSYPTLTLVRGATYTFDVQTSSFHPFHIEAPGLAVNDISSGLISFSVPTNNENYYYECSVHGLQMRGNIATVAAPTVKILDVTVGTNLLVTSTLTNEWKIFPEYQTNLMATNWFALTVETNRLVGGVRETICGRPEGQAVFIRLRASP